MREEKKEKLRSIKSRYGLVDAMVKFYKDLTILVGRGNDVAVVLDKDYNVIDFCKASEISDKDLRNREVTDKLLYPFDSYTISDIITISNEVDVKKGISNKDESSDYDKVLSYIKFLNIELENYINYSYHLLSLGVAIPHFSEYVNSIINKINRLVIDDLRLHYKPIPSKVLYTLGQKDELSFYIDYIRNIIDVYMKNMGLKDRENAVNRLDYIDDRERVSIKDVADQILEDHKDKEIKNGRTFK